MTTWSRESTTDAHWSGNKTLQDLVDDATTYNDSDTTYSLATEYYNGYNPGSYTPDGSTPASWTKETPVAADWTRE